MKPIILDLFCCAGGASVGYSLAGYEVFGIDKDEQPNYPFPMWVESALKLNPTWIRRNFHAVHASPPCQFGTALRHAPGAKKHKNLIPATRRLLEATGLPYIIENVEGARSHLRDPIMLCGSMFDLGAAGHQLRRHRYFESNVSISAPCECNHRSPVIGMYGGHVRCRAAAHGGRGTKDFVGHDKPALARKAMGMDWATMNEMSEAIPPAYTKHLGEQIYAAARMRRAA